jgi:hypothetical protein
MLELPQPGFPSPWEERMPGVVDETLFTFHVSVRSRVCTRVVVRHPRARCYPDIALRSCEGVEALGKDGLTAVREKELET